jgi:hypothetical protein
MLLLESAPTRPNPDPLCGSTSCPAQELTRLRGEVMWATHSTDADGPSNCPSDCERAKCFESVSQFGCVIRLPVRRSRVGKLTKSLLRAFLGRQKIFWEPMIDFDGDFAR